MTPASEKFLQLVHTHSWGLFPIAKAIQERAENMPETEHYSKLSMAFQREKETKTSCPSSENGMTFSLTFGQIS